jgi:hypothetical protein
VHRPPELHYAPASHGYAPALQRLAGGASLAHGANPPGALGSASAAADGTAAAFAADSARSAGGAGTRSSAAGTVFSSAAGTFFSSAAGAFFSSATTASAAVPSKGLVQRVLDGTSANDLPASNDSPPGAELDLDALTDEVYARLRWRLTFERERILGANY